MSLLFHKDFSDALTGANGFDSTLASNGTIVQSAGAGLNGTSGGVTCTRTTAGVMSVYGRDTDAFTGKTLMRTAFFCDVSALTFAANNDSVYICFANASIGSFAWALRPIRLAGIFKLRHYLYRDDGSNVSNDVVVGNLVWMELRVQKASSGATADAQSQLYFGGGDYPAAGELVSEITGILHYTRFDISQFNLGLWNGAAGVDGSAIVDEWSLRDDDEPILFGVSDSAIARGMKYVLNRRRRKSYCW